MGEKLSLRQITEKASEFERKLNRLKAHVGGDGLRWYPYHSLGNFTILDQFLTDVQRSLFDVIQPDDILLDLGCADGDVAFFLESLGFRVRAIDNPATNYNGMRGVEALKAALKSSIEISAIDLDRPFAFPEQRYACAFFLGTLYHLKNPFYVLETLAWRARYCVLSTRIARFAPHKSTDLRDVAVAFLLADRETNSDATNYWIFSEAGLRRLFDRTGWTVCDYLSVGNTVASDPVTSEGDERAFCLLRSGQVDKITTGELLVGWHDIENGWRWTAREFSARFNDVDPERPVSLRLRFALPDSVLTRIGSITLFPTVNGLALPARTYSEAGEHTYAAPVPASVFGSPSALVEFRLDKALPPSDADGRELGVIVERLELV